MSEEEAFSNIIEACKVLGWSMCISEEDFTGSDKVVGMVIGEGKYMDKVLSHLAD